MSDDGLDLQVTGLAAGLAESIAPQLRLAVAALDLGSLLTGVTVCADDLPGSDDAWLRFSRRGGDLLRLLLYCRAESFCQMTPDSAATFPPREVWEQAAAPSDQIPLGSEDFSRERSDAFLHHHLLLGRDLLRGELEPASVPVGQLEAFSASWATVVDGRLGRAGLPGYSLTERRARFSRLFSAAGVLMPDHWQIFQALWDGALSTQKDVVGVLRQLPRL